MACPMGWAHITPMAVLVGDRIQPTLRPPRLSDWHLSLVSVLMVYYLRHPPHDVARGGNDADVQPATNSQPWIPVVEENNIMLQVSPVCFLFKKCTNFQT
jgi:hypothetical protein